MDSKLNPLFEEAVQSKKVPAVAGVVLDKSGDVLFKGAFGTNDIDDPSTKFTSTTPLFLWSCTKVVTCVAALQLYEQGKIKLDDPAEKYVPDIAKKEIVESFDDQGEAKVTEAKKKPTILNLMTHTAGFSYDFFEEKTLKWRSFKKQNPAGYVGVGGKDDFDTPLIFEPGSRYEYGINIDWLGWVVEAVSGLPLEQYIEKHIVKPLGMNDTVTHFKDPSSKARLLVHIKGEDGKVVPNADIVPAANPYKYGGGHYLLSTLDDYSIFLLTLLNEGTHPKSGVKILEAKTVKECLFEDKLANICSNQGVGAVSATIPLFSNNGELSPGVNKGWSCGVMLNLEDTPKGRKAGSGSWAGLGNNYYWIDPKAGKLGWIVSSVLPFLDRDVLYLFDQMERVTYGHEVTKDIGGKDSNFVVHDKLPEIEKLKV